MKQIEFISDKVLEEVCTITGNFWQTQVSGAQIIEDTYYENNRVRVMRISHSMSLMSYGENFHMVFERLPEKINQTKITITINLKFGYGAQWKKPSDILIKWAHFMGLDPIDFGRKPFIITWAILGTLLALSVLIPVIVLILVL